jgi:hypothetical protein
MAKKKKNRIKITWSIDADLIKEVKHKAIDMDIDTSSVIENAIIYWLDKKPDKMSQAAKKAWITRKGNAKNE